MKAPKLKKRLPGDSFDPDGVWERYTQIRVLEQKEAALSLALDQVRHQLLVARAAALVLNDPAAPTNPRVRGGAV